ncbi:hypothetical protein TURU_004516 [Turdus rufiventris]|nr:hypothetical protein TURU_004516 [Turdus rufiventris]
MGKTVERNRRAHIINKWLKGWCYVQNSRFFDHGETFLAPGGGVALYIREAFDAMDVETNDSDIECLWATIKGKANKADILLGVCPPNQGEEVDNSFYKQLDNASGSSALVLVGDFNLPDFC